MYSVTFAHLQKRSLIQYTKRNEKRTINNLSDRKKIRVIFLAIHASVWKVDSVFKRMLDDPLFEPEILICPSTIHGARLMHEDMSRASEYFRLKGYPIRSALKDDGTWLELADLNPDIVFFTNPYKLTKSQYYEDAYKNYLSCYVPYYFMATNHAGNIVEQMNTHMLNAMWRIYWPHDYIFKEFSHHSVIKGKNSMVVGYPATESLLNTESISKDTWKTQSFKKKRVIYAPHHTISDDDASLSTFLRYGSLLKELAVEFQKEIQWSFKPHPMLKNKLYLHPDWGKGRTDKYYSFWENEDFTQIDLGGYDDLFVQSDAIIHDCSSFIVEYAFTRKPALYLFNEGRTGDSFLNDFGKGVFEMHSRATKSEDINNFLINLVNENNSRVKLNSTFFDIYLDEFYGEALPSEMIINDIKRGLSL